MRFYFKLQYRMLNRWLIDFGVKPIFGYGAAVAIYVFGSYYLFELTDLAAYIYSFIALAFIGKLSEPDRNDFLKQIHSKRGYRRLRLIENSILALPFLAFLLFTNNFLLASSLFVLSILMAVLSLKSNFNFRIPTPFSKRPFEFSTGFRRSWPVFILAYFLTYMAISVPNFNVGLLALLLLFITSASYYSVPENKFYVWIFAKSPKQFLLYKIKNAMLHSSLLNVPVIIALGIFFPESIPILVGVMALSYIYLITFVLAKYSAFPHEMSVAQGLLLAISLAAPPLLLGTIPYFYSRSLERLNKLLV